jgi:hypothetical protein
VPVVVCNLLPVAVKSASRLPALINGNFEVGHAFVLSDDGFAPTVGGDSGVWLSLR